MVHPEAQHFDHAAAAYERGRPEYPNDALKLIVQTCGLSAQSTVLELAAGTGKFTRQLTQTGARIIAVEPVQGMRTALASAVPDVELYAGAAEAIPLPAGAVDAVMVAQAFHWFEIAKAAAEIHRVLRPQGSLALLWNRRDFTQPLHRDIRELVAPYRAAKPRSFQWRQKLAETQLFTPLEAYHIPHIQTTDSEGLVDRVLSFSYIARLPDAEKSKLRAQIYALTAQLPERFELRHTTMVFICYAQ